jgi:hypothetical protein
MFTFKIKPDGGEPIQFESDSRDVANWERTTKDATMGQLGADNGAGLSYVALYRIAYFAAKRQGLIGPMTESEFNRGYALDLVDPDAAEGSARDEPQLDELVELVMEDEDLALTHGVVNVNGVTTAV